MSSLPRFVCDAGKLFRSSDLHTLASFFLMFHKDKPIDWLLDHFLFVKVCNPEQDMVCLCVSQTLLYLIYVSVSEAMWKGQGSNPNSL